MATSIAEMIKKAAEDVGTTSTSESTPTGGDSVEESGGIQIERQNIEHVQGQAKSGGCDGDGCSL